MVKRPDRGSTVSAYLELVRPANVTTALADVLAGYGVAGLGDVRALGWLLLATAGLYAGGIVFNDFFDRRIDAIERPERPIPSGRVTPATAAWVGAALLAIGVVAAAQASREAAIIAATIAIAALIYDAWGKHQRLLGPLNMASCRALNLLLGLSAVPPMLAERWPVAFLPLIYIAGVTTLSRGEVRGGSRLTAAISLVAVHGVVVSLMVTSIRTPGSAIGGLVLTLLFAGRVLPAFYRALRNADAQTIRNAVRTGVLSLVLLDAAIGGVYAGAPYGLLILALAPVAWLLARAFAVT